MAQTAGPVQNGGLLGLPASTVHAVLVRCRINRLARIDRVTGEPLRHHEHTYPGSLIHVDVTKFGNIPHGADRNPRTGTASVHTVIDPTAQPAASRRSPG